MISKVITGKTFYGACRYICMDKSRAVVLDSCGVRDYNHKLMAGDFELQHSLRPSLSKAVFHGIISFYPGEKIDDKTMAAIAREYLNQMKITNTQYVIVRHMDKNHQHLHVLANLVNNNGEVIKDNWIGLRGKKVAQSLTLKYGLTPAVSKNLKLTNLEALNEREAGRYIIYQAILNKLPRCKSLDDLKEKLARENIETLYKYKGQTDELQGISFRMGEYKYKGSEIDRKFSLTHLEKTLKLSPAEKLIKSPLAVACRMDISENNKPEKELVQNSSKVLEALLKPERKSQMQAPAWPLQKKRKSRSRGLHL